jgi:hypothetical protein
MGFQNPITSIAAVDTGVSGPRIRVNPTGGTYGGGAVEVWPDGTDYFGPGYLEGGHDVQGPLVQLSSQQNVDGLRNTVTMGDDVAGGRRGVEIRSTQDVSLAPGPGGHTIAYNLQAPPVVTVFTRGFDMFSEFDHYGNPFRKLRRWITPDGEQRVKGLIKPTINLAAGTAYSMFYLSDYVLGSDVLDAWVNATTKVRLDAPNAGSVVQWWAGNPAVTAGAYIEIDLAIPIGTAHPSGW